MERFVSANPDVEREIDEWCKSTSPVPMVGSRHHTVPRSCLERFAKNGQLWVRDRVTGDGRATATTRTGVIRDFYTFINLDGEKDGRLEQILASVEKAANELFDRMLNPFRPARPLDGEESIRLGLFLAFQLQRTPRQRREVELMGDFLVKTQNRHLPALDQWRVVPNPNFHLEQMTKLAPRISEAFFFRPTTLITIDQPLFITCDEPVILAMDGDESHVRHAASCHRSTRRRKKDARKPSRARLRNADIIHIYPTRPGAAQATEVGLPLTPRTLLVLGPRGMATPLRCSITGADAVALADDVNARLVEHAYNWVASHPDHSTFRSMPFPPPGPIVRTCDGGTAASRQMERAPSPRRPELLGRGFEGEKSSR